MKALTPNELEAFLESQSAAFDVRAPIRLHDGTRVLGSLGEGALELRGGPLPRKPTTVFFPQQEQIVRFAQDGTTSVPPVAEKPLFVVGFTAEDLECLEFLDRFFARGLRDDVYFAKRDGAIVAGVSGRCGLGGRLMRIAGGNCDLEFIVDDETCIVAAHTEAGKAIEAAIACAEQDASLDALQRESDALPARGKEVVLKASELIRADKVPDEFWGEIGDRCIACTGCNLVCPTCTCFDMLDWTDDAGVERSRVWDSCLYDGFMREASSHNPMGTEAQRTRRRIHHKLAADPERWGHVTCFVCGRCDAVCPVNVGIISVCGEIVSRFG